MEGFHHGGSKHFFLQKYALGHAGIGRNAVQVSARQEALLQRREGDESRSAFLAQVYEAAALGNPVNDIVPVLIEEAGHIVVGRYL